MTDQLDNLNARLTILQAAVERLATITHDTQQRMDGHTQWSAGKWEELSKQARIERAAMDAVAVRVGRLERGEVATVATPRIPLGMEAELSRKIEHVQQQFADDLVHIRSDLRRMHTALADALQADGEQGSAWLSEAFAKRFRIEHPELCAWLENFTKWVTEELED